MGAAPALHAGAAPIALIYPIMIANCPIILKSRLDFVGYPSLPRPSLPKCGKGGSKKNKVLFARACAGKKHQKVKIHPQGVRK